MLQAQAAADPHNAVNATSLAGEPVLPLDLLELELSLDGLSAEGLDFREAVAQAVERIDGEYLFDLPASGLAEDCLRIAALRVPSDAGDWRVVLALLAADGATIRVEHPSERTEGLRRFAEAFVGVLERI